MKLYEYTQDYLRILEMAEDLDPEVLVDTLQAIQEGLEKKAENVAKLVRNFEANCKTIKEEEERLSSKRKTLENQISYLKTYLQQQLEAVELEKVKTPLFTIAIQANPPGVHVSDEGAIPGQFWIQSQPKLDKKGIMESLKAGGEVPGCEIRRSKGLRIR